MSARPDGKTRKKQSWLPASDVDALARCLLPSIEAYFGTEEGQREYAAWLVSKQDDGADTETVGGDTISV